MTLNCQKSPFLRAELLAKIDSGPPRPCVVYFWQVIWQVQKGYRPQL